MTVDEERGSEQEVVALLLLQLGSTREKAQKTGVR